MSADRVEFLGRGTIGFRGAADREAVEREADDLAGLVAVHDRWRTVVMVFMTEAGVAALGVERGDVLESRDAVDRFRREEADAVGADAEAGARGELRLAQRRDLLGGLRVLRQEEGDDLFERLQFDDRIRDAFLRGLFVSPAGEFLSGDLIELRAILRAVYRAVLIEHVPAALVQGLEIVGIDAVQLLVDGVFPVSALVFEGGRCPWTHVVIIGQGADDNLIDRGFGAVAEDTLDLGDRFHQGALVEERREVDRGGSGPQAEGEPDEREGSHGPRIMPQTPLTQH